MSPITRRGFLQGTVAMSAATTVPFGAAQANAAEPEVSAPLRWLEGGAPSEHLGTTWGTPWPRGQLRPEQEFTLRTGEGGEIPLQSWPIAYWPDGSLKWSAHAVGPSAQVEESYTLEPGPSAATPTTVRVTSTDQYVDVDTGVIRARINKHGTHLVAELARGDKTIAKNGHLVLLQQDAIVDSEERTVRQRKLLSTVERVTVEQSGPIRSVVRVEGRHAWRSGRPWLPFTIRFYFYAGAESVRLVHTLVFDGDAERDFVTGLGIRFAVPMRDQLHDRHIRLAGKDAGMLTEAVRGLTGLRRDPGASVRTAQVEGRPTPPVETFPTNVRSRLHLIPTWGDYTLSQLSADGFAIRKRTKAGHGWVEVGGGTRADGFGYVGGITGGLAFGLRNFWQLHPTQLDIRNAASDEAEVTLWLWSPDAGPMDVRFYHDGLGQDTYPEQLDGLEITYEDYEPEFGTATGVARTTELALWALDATPTTQRLAQLAEANTTPPLIVATPQHLHSAGVFGDWSLVDRSTPAKAEIEDRLDFLFDYYTQQVDQHHWYGFWNYGDVMHTYDGDRHMWRYDVGGYAWDNSELSPDLWLWYAYLRSGRADIYRFAEAMTRHTGEVDVYHLGRFAGLGTRHNVQHWGDSAKQVRISTAAYRRFFYFLTADERVGDLMHALVDADKTFLTLDPIRKIRTEPYEPDPHALSIGTGTDYSALAAAWLTEWERGGDPIAKTKLLNSMRTIGEMPIGFFSSGALYDIDDGRYHGATAEVSVSHLSAVFGQVEINSELLSLIDDPGFETAWLQYCRLYNATAEEQRAELGQPLGNLNLGQAHARLTAYAAAKTGSAALAQRAWDEFYRGAAGYGPSTPWRTEQISPPVVLNPVDEAAWVSTNATAQWALPAIQCLALVGDHLPER